MPRGQGHERVAPRDADPHVEPASAAFLAHRDTRNRLGGRGHPPDALPPDVLTLLRDVTIHGVRASEHTDHMAEAVTRARVRAPLRRRRPRARVPAALPPAQHRAEPDAKGCRVTDSAPHNPYEWDRNNPEVQLPRTALIDALQGAVLRGLGVRLVGGRGMGKSVTPAASAAASRGRGDWSRPHRRTAARGNAPGLPRRCGRGPRLADGAAVEASEMSSTPRSGEAPGFERVVLLFDEVDQYVQRRVHDGAARPRVAKPRRSNPPQQRPPQAHRHRRCGRCGTSLLEHVIGSASPSRAETVCLTPLSRDELAGLGGPVATRGGAARRQRARRHRRDDGLRSRAGHLRARRALDRAGGEEQRGPCERSSSFGARTRASLDNIRTLRLAPRPLRRSEQGASPRRGPRRDGPSQPPAEACTSPDGARAIRSTV